MLWTALGVGYNLVLGFAAYFPIDFTYWLVSGPPPGNHRDTLPLFVAITVLSWVVVLALAVAPNIPLARRSFLPGSVYGVIAALLVLVIPTGKMMPIVRVVGF
ncbi:hypothetical protein [Nonomuraea sp. NPDC050310]|uniref:hypothetical protein n=1 Tax=Nonomuraea sp. NPDC050310 TaxID=3154935 RepID=UPI0033F2CD77